MKKILFKQKGVHYQHHIVEQVTDNEVHLSVLHRVDFIRYLKSEDNPHDYMNVREEPYTIESIAYVEPWATYIVPISDWEKDEVVLDFYKGQPLK